MAASAGHSGDRRSDLLGTELPFRLDATAMDGNRFHRKSPTDLESWTRQQTVLFRETS